MLKHSGTIFILLALLVTSCKKHDDEIKQDTDVSEVQLAGGEYEMGDHFGFVDPGHPSDETPLHKVKVNSFYIATTETTNKQFLEFLNSSLEKGSIEVRSNIVYAFDGNNAYYYTHKYASYYSIGNDGKTFSIADFRANHPVVGVMWCGAAAYCNWLSLQKGLKGCYNLSTRVCDFTKNGYRLPTEAEWEYAARGGYTNPYFNYPNGNTIDITSVNLPDSHDPYETGDYPNTTPVGFYNGKLKLKSEYNWPGSATTYQTSNGVNGFGLYDMEGNVWEFVNDWYGQNYYSVSPYDNPKGPDTGFLMPDGRPYRGMRGGNYSIASGSAFAPANFTWTYKGTSSDPMYSENISGAYRLPNGNTIICSGTIGLFLEVTSAGEIVWKYICPVQGTGPITQGNKPDDDLARTGETMNSVFRVYKYPTSYAAFVGKILTPGDYIEIYP